MKHFKLKSIKQDSGILYITLEPRRKSDRLSFSPGQYATIGFKGTSGRRSPMRCFSIVSSPLNPDQLEFAMRLGGRFTYSLSELVPGTDMYVQGPFGNFVVDKNYDKNIVMLAGGIGITPFISIIRTATMTGDFPPITLLHSYRGGHHIPFHDELKKLQKANNKLRVATFITDKATTPESPNLLSGKITEKHIEQVTGDQYANSTYFICGPKGFMDNTTSMLEANGVHKDRIVTESFTQSSSLTFGKYYNVQKLTYAFSSALLLIGLSGIVYIDLSRYLPKYASAETKSQSATNSTTNNSNASNSNSSANNSTVTPTTNNSSSNNQTTSTYQSPVTTVS